MIECPLAEDILVKFLSPEKEPYTKPIHLWCPKGDYTQSWEDRALVRLGAEAYAHLHTDTFVTNGRIGLLFQSYKHPLGEKSNAVRVPTEWLWCAENVREGAHCAPAPAEEIALVPPDIRGQLDLLPSLEFCVVQPFPIHSCGEKRKKKLELCAPPDGLVFFRFTGGVGFCLAAQRPKAPARKAKARKGVAA